MRRLACAAWPRALRRAHTSAQTLYEALGVPHGCRDVDAIKTAFREKARTLHPDTQAGGGGDAEAFVRLAHAKETLCCPDKRALYEASLEASAWRASAARAASRGDGGTHAHREQRSPHADADADAVVRDAALQALLNDALARAYHGPPVDLAAAAAGELPACFEGEERAEAHRDLLQLVSGRTFLGCVRHVGWAALAPGGASLARGDAALAGASSDAFALDEAAALGAADAAAASDAPPEFDQLRLVTRGGQVVASARRRPQAQAQAPAKHAPPWPDDGAGAGDIEIELRDAPPCRVTAAGGGYGVGKVCDADGCVTHTVVLHSTPWVSHLHVLAPDGASPAALACLLAGLLACVCEQH
jgi:hypothetical protein